ncbi:uncharacterized protein BHQ10_006858 [Talaromyces amestolkiae]|uniref:Copper transporter n=1 Tax=Talaromyces amestolkiae TaxID=1196081 RepID=A0A364L4X0_TALAM|nr:uncharacterized protein BHQ10_006858 [Talaromyces amestolkiae]RAO70846.1 hypothetical protein BHQ10_006858 [Talaromyces amestolkiae]
MVSSLFRSDSVSSRMRKRFSLPAYTNKSLYVDEQKPEFRYVDLEATLPSPQPPVAVRPQLRTKDEAQLRQAVTNLYQQVDQNDGTQTEQDEARPEPDTTAAEPGVKRPRSRRSIALDTLSSLSRRLSVVVEPTENEKSGIDGDFASGQDDPFLQFNGLLYNFEFGSPLSRASRVFEAGTPDAETSYGRYRPRNPAARAKKSRYSWGGFDLAHRNDGYADDRDDLIAILEHDESNLNDAAVAAPVVAGPSSQVPRRPSPRTSHYQDMRRSGIVVDDTRADSIAAGAAVKIDSMQRTTNTTNVSTNANANNDSSSSENIHAFIPLSRVANQSEPPTSEKKRGFISKSWRITSHGMFAGSCIGVILLVMSLEFFRRLSKEYDRHILHQFKQKIALGGAAIPTPQKSTPKHATTTTTTTDSADDANSTNHHSTDTTTSKIHFRPSPIQQSIRALLHMITFAIAYFVMLLAMYYNGYFIICIFIGAYLGAFVFSWESIGVEMGSSVTATAAMEDVTVCCG